MSLEQGPQITGESRPALPPQASNDLSVAESFYFQIQSESRRLHLGLDIARLKAARSLPYDQITDNILSSVGGYSDIDAALAYRGLAGVYAIEGKIDRALETVTVGTNANIDREYLLPWAYLDFALVQVEQGGGYPFDTMEKAEDSIRTSDPLSKLVVRLKMAKIKTRAGVNSRDDIDSVVKYLDGLPVHHQRDKLSYYQDAVEAYAFNNDFGLAFQTLPKIVDEEDPSRTVSERNYAMLHIINKLIDTGRFDQALSAVWGVDWDSVARVYADAALGMAKRGLNPEDTIRRAQEYVGWAANEADSSDIDISPSNRESLKAHSALTLVTVAQAKAVSTKESDAGLIISAMDFIRREPNTEARAELMSDVGQKISEIGWDSRTIFLEALGEADKLFVPDESDDEIMKDDPDSVVLSMISHIPLYESILKTGIKAGQHDFVEMGSQKLDELQARFGVVLTDAKAELFLERAEALAS